MTAVHAHSGDAIPGCLLALSAVTALAFSTLLFISDLQKYCSNSTFSHCCRYCTVSCAGSMFQRASTLPVTVATMPPDTKKQCNGATPATAPVSCKGTTPAPSPAVPVQEPPKMSPRDYIFGKTIGEGSFSTVSWFLVGLQQ